MVNLWKIIGKVAVKVLLIFHASFDDKNSRGNSGGIMAFIAGFRGRFTIRVLGGRQ